MTVVVMNIHTQNPPLNHSQDQTNCVQHSHKMIYHTPEEDEENDWNDFQRLLKRVEGEVHLQKSGRSYNKLVKTEWTQNPTIT